MRLLHSCNKIGNPAAYLLEKPAQMIQCDYQAWPTVRVSPPGRVEDSELHSFLVAFAGECAKREGRCVVVLDLHGVEQFTVAQRKMLTDHMSGSVEGRIEGCAMVFDSRLMTGLLTAILWVYRPEYPTRVFSELDEAIRWARETSSAAEASRSRRAPSVRRTPSGAYVVAPPSSSQAAEKAIMRMPKEGNWILQSGASRDKTGAKQRVEALRSSDECAYLCERWVSSELSLWLAWVGPYADLKEALLAREDWARRGFILTVSQWKLVGPN